MRVLRFELLIKKWIQNTMKIMYNSDTLRFRSVIPRRNISNAQNFCSNSANFFNKSKSVLRQLKARWNASRITNPLSPLWIKGQRSKCNE